MKNNYSISVFANKVRRLSKKIKTATLLLVFVIAITGNSFAQLTRAQVITKAQSFQTLNWTVSGVNVTTGSYKPYNCDGVSTKWTLTPSWVNPTNGQPTSKISVPYAWGGFISTSAYVSGIGAGKLAGDRQTTFPNSNTQYSCGTSAAVGVDCSGAVSQWWGLSSKKNCTQLNAISTQLSGWSLAQAGDIANKPSSHVRLITSYNASTGLVNVIEASAVDWKVSSRSYSPGTLTNDGYTPRKWNSIIEVCNAPTNLYGTNLTSTTINIYWSGSASQYRIGLKRSNSSTWQEWTIPTAGVAFTGLTPLGNYHFRVKSLCGNSSSSYVVVSFSTPLFKTDETHGLINPDNLHVISLDGTLSEEELGLVNNISLSPNPVRSGEMLILAGLSGNNNTISLYSLDGQMLKEVRTTGAASTFPIPQGITAGVYFIRIADNDGNLNTRKILVQ